MLKLFKTIAILEGISSILLFFIAMPLKYIFKNEQYMRSIGMLHGILFCFFIAIAIYFSVQEKWNFKKNAIVFIAAVLPCGTFYVDKKYLKNA
jgi:integral membrane protein